MKATKEFLSDLKKADSMVIRFNGAFSTIDLFYGQSADQKIITYQYGTSGELMGTWHMFLYPKMKTQIGDTLNLIKIGDDIRFEAEFNGNQYTTEANLIVTNLYLTIKAYRQDGITLKKLSSYFLDHQICPDNSALNLPVMAKKMQQARLYLVS